MPAPGIEERFSFFIPVCVRPEPFHRPQRPEHRLMMAVLEDAVRCAFGYSAVRRYEHDEHGETEDPKDCALKWFASDAENWPFAFVRICQEFDLDPEAVRIAIQKQLHTPTLVRRKLMHSHRTRHQQIGTAQWKSRTVEARRLRAAAR